MQRSKPSKATTSAQSALQDALQRYPPDHPIVSEATWDLASIYANEGNFQDARDLLESTLRAWQLASGVSPWVVANFEDLLASVLSHLGDSAGAIPLIKSALEVLEREDPADERVWWALERLAVDLNQLGMFEEVLDVRRQIIEWLRRFAGQNEKEIIRASARSAGTLEKMGRFGEARDAFFELLDRARGTQDARLVVDCKRNIVEASMELEDWSSAATMACELIEEASDLLGPDDDFGQFARRWRHTFEAGLTPLAQGSANLRQKKRAQKLLEAIVKTDEGAVTS